MLSPSDEPPLHFKATLENDLEVLCRRKDGGACCDHAPGDLCRPTGAQKAVSISGIGLRFSRDLLPNISTTTVTSSPKKGRNHVTGYFDFHYETKRGRRPDARRWTGRRIAGG
jgi:hypothetical protein